MRINENSDSSAYRLFLNAFHNRTEPSSRWTLRGDALNLSPFGKGLAGKLVVRSGGIATKSMDSVGSLSDSSMRLMGTSLIEVKEVLEKMKELTEKAKDSQLSWDERIDLQIEMAEQQAILHEKTHNMGMSLAQPDNAGTFIDGNILEQRDRVIAFLENMRATGPASDEAQGNITYFDSNGGLVSMVGYYSTDFELDENGYLKMRDDLFDALPESSMTSLEETFTRFANRFYPANDMTDEEIFENMGLSLLDSGNAAESAAKIQGQLDALTEVEAEFNRLATVDPTVTRQYENALRSEGGLFQTVLGLMQYQAKGADEISKDPLDVRLTGADDPIGGLFMKIDKLFKDKIYSSLGLGDVYRNEQKPTGISPEQLALIEEIKAKIAARDADKADKGIQEESPLAKLDIQSAVIDV